MAPRIAVVSDENRFLRWADRREVHAHRLPHRSIQAFVFNAAGELLIQRRHEGKLTFPGFWDISCAGHVEETDHAHGRDGDIDPDADLDRVYEAVARREIEEELGVRVDVTLLGRFGPEPGVHYEHVHLYRAEHEGPFTCQPDEVAEVRFVGPAAFDTMVREGREPVVPALVWFVAWARTRVGLFLPR